MTQYDQVDIGPVPPEPDEIRDTGISTNSLLRLLLKAMYVRGLEVATQLSEDLKLNRAIVRELLDEGRERKLVQTLGMDGSGLHSEIRYGLTGEGQSWASEALEQSLYIGPAPVSLETYSEQVARQRLMGERVDEANLSGGLDHLVIPPSLIRRLGQAVNSSRPMLLYGSPGNGKTTVAEVMGTLFSDTIYIPYCIEVDQQIIKVFDPTLHVPVPDHNATNGATNGGRRYVPDPRWVPCRRPVVKTAGELTLEMLDLRYNPHSRFYEAPLHVKAIGGTFLIDDLGRQLLQPEELLNRWIGPMEKRIDYLTLNTGRTFEVPFDELLIFSTNLTPEDLMDPAFLRRIGYKIEMIKPTPEHFREVFQRLCDKYDIPYEENVVNFAMEKIQTDLGQPLAFYQPQFLVDQVLASCKYEEVPPRLTTELVIDAMDNMTAKEVDREPERASTAAYESPPERSAAPGHPGFFDH
jgi:hypothetical protein